MIRRRPPRLADDLYLGTHRIFITMCTFERRAYFRDDQLTDSVRWQLVQSASVHGIEILAYCFMPDHLHALIAGGAIGSDAKDYLTAFRQRSGYLHRRTHRNRLWQPGYFDRHLRSVDATLDVVSYIVCNPVRARISATAEQYRWSGSSVYSLRDIVRDVQWTPRSLG
jgi:putative transposase